MASATSTSHAPEAQAAARDARRDAVRLRWVFAAAALLLQLLVLPRYGIFRDELYYLACSHHMAWGYVDQPPFSIAVLWLTRSLFGESLRAIRTPPALAMAASVALTGRLAQDAGGRRTAQVLAMTAAFVAPVYLALAHIFTMNAFDVLAWTTALCVLMRVVERADPRQWLLLGILLGVGLLNKISVLWLIVGMAAGLLITPYRRLLRTPGPWLSIAVSALLFAPYVAWNMAHHWPAPEFIRNATTLKMADMPPGRFIASQLALMHPLTAPLWLTGLVWSLASRHAGRWRLCGIVYLTVAAILIANGKSRAEYLAPAYPALLALGAAVWERACASRAVRLLPAAATIVIAAAGVALMPAVLPLLSPPQLVRFLAALHASPPQEEKSRTGALPQYFADMFGWQHLAATVGQVYARLPLAERRGCAIFTSNYGEAGAIDYYGARYGLPPAISGHNNYWLWGPRGWNGQTVIVVNSQPAWMATAFRSGAQVATVHSPYCMPEEQDAPIYVARGLKMPVSQFWARVKHYE